MNAAPRYREGGEAPALARLPDEWKAWAASLGERPFRGLQIFKWLHGRQQIDAQAMTNLPRDTRARLQAELAPRLPTVANEHQSTDATRKLVVRMGDGALVETVLIPMTDAVERNDDASEDDFDAGLAGGADDQQPRRRVTQCVSTQAGCAMGCTFCASGEHGLLRHLGPDEIVAQVLLGKQRLGDDERLGNVVLMGMGEPLHNYDATLRAIRVLAHDDGLGLSTRRVTISTVGLIPGIERLGRDLQGRIGLAISLHAPDDATRSRLVPVNRRYPLPRLMDALRKFPLPPRRRITIEYALIDGVNDTDADARRLSRLLRGIPVKVNLIPLNPVAHAQLRPSPQPRVLAFQQVLHGAGVSCFIRRRRGDDIAAACGQLANRTA